MNLNSMELPVEDIMLNYAPVYPGENSTWAETISYLLNIDSERKIVERLRDILEVDGTFREPIFLETEESRQQLNAMLTEGNEEEDTSRLKVLDGTHRVAAAYLAQQLSIPVVYDRVSAVVEDDDWDYPDDAYLNTTIIVDPESVDAAMDVLIEGARSFELTRDIWLTTGCLGGSNNEMSIAWDIDGGSAESLTAEHYDAIDSLVKAVLTEAGIAYQAVYTHIEVYS